MDATYHWDMESMAETIKRDFVVKESIFGGNHILFRCEKPLNPEENANRLINKLSEIDYVPFISQNGEDVLITVRPQIKTKESGPGTKHLILFILTILTTLWAGTVLLGIDLMRNPLLIWKGWPFALAIMTVLGMHELGHYIMSKKRNVVATLPFFIPAPNPLLGTFGAVISMKSPMPDRKSMFDIGISGPVLGLVFAVPVTIIGLMNSPIDVQLPLDGEQGVGIALGIPLIYQALIELVPVNLNEGLLHPVAFAGWVGFFVTFLNLLPVGQLDGGHIARALLGNWYKYLSGSVPLILFGMGFVLSTLGYNGTIWIIWGLIGSFFHSVGHPPPLNDISHLDYKRKIAGLLIFGVMLACFTPVPFQML
ncbi:MAG: site-2 protease family protein [Archaeoglobaceae archaeon]